MLLFDLVSELLGVRFLLKPSCLSALCVHLVRLERLAEYVLSLSSLSLHFFFPSGLMLL